VTQLWRKAKLTADGKVPVHAQQRPSRSYRGTAVFASEQTKHGVGDMGAFASRDTMRIGRWMPIGSELARGMGFAAQGGGALWQPE